MTRRSLLTIAALLFHASVLLAQVSPRPADTSRGVTLALTEYNRLTDLATPVASAVPPVAAVLSTADLRVRVDGGTARGDFVLSGEVLQPGAARVPLLANATVLGANVDGQPLPLVVNGTLHAAIVNGPGPFTANLQWGAPLLLTPGRASFVLPIALAGTVRATIDLPGEQADVHLTGGVITRRTIENGRTIVESTLELGIAADVSWSMRDSAPVAATRDARTVADVLTLVTLGHAEIRMLALVDLTVLRGEPRIVEIRLPGGYQLTGVTGNALEVTEPVDGLVRVTLAEPGARHHQFLVALEQPHKDGGFAFDTGFVSVGDAQRERGEAAVEGVGTLDLSATTTDDVHRIDIRELNTALSALARTPLLAGFRYQRTPASAPAVTLSVNRFGDSSVLAASVDYANATTLVTSQGRALTEISLHIQNHAQPFLKVVLPTGATMVSVTVANEPAKPVAGEDGTRVPLLRPGFRPSGAYDVSFVYMHASAPFARKGDVSMTLPRMDIPVGVVYWNVFAPEAYRMRRVGGNAISAEAVGRAEMKSLSRTAPPPVYRPERSVEARPHITTLGSSLAGHIEGLVKDPSGAVLPGVTVEISSPAMIQKTIAAVTDAAGRFAFEHVPSGNATMMATLPGFQTVRVEFAVGGVGVRVDMEMGVAALAETVMVTAQSTRRDEQKEEDVIVEPSPSVVGIQQKVAGVLPIPIDVPRTGVNLRFSRPLVLDDETRVDFRYKRR